ncbi:hypothetical protein SAMN05216228_100632 [Rhizobium tibeticum]|uniref:Uncharacterized protein n=1 Tax=Rhizobium tibeticum TaxID=501024 RepID=A0A1H8I8W9_9HYPH|nr:hypothetical protein RTCCBAU85039_1822 [Rhizobium tibeticum]SEN64318.1 hypothetical protein SAMN05216228_100632 [Rhizobium tibeticum]
MMLMSPVPGHLEAKCILLNFVTISCFRKGSRIDGGGLCEQRSWHVWAAWKPRLVLIDVNIHFEGEAILAVDTRQ